VALMCCDRVRRSFDPMINTTHIRPIIGIAFAVLLLFVALSPSSGRAAGRTETVRFFSKPVSFTYTAADGTVTHRPPAGPPQAGDALEVDSLDYAGTHKKHARRPTGSDYVHCAFNGGPEPDCFGSAAVGGSLLRFHNMDLIGAIGRWKSGKVISNKEVKGGSDFVLRLKRN
jgi:hypothetical protein